MITIQDAQGNNIDVPVTLSNGMVDAMLRADTTAEFEAGLKMSGIWVQVDGLWQLAPGMGLDVIGPIVLTAAVYGDDDTLVTPSIVDSRIHANLRLSSAVVSRNEWKKWAITWTQNGSSNIDPNSNEAGTKLSGITLIDPDTIAQRKRVFL